jgi:hypothetical protein
MGQDLNYKEVWNGEYRGVRFEVVHWRLGWNYYIDIPVDQLPDNIKSMFNLRSRIYKLSDDGREHIAFEYSSAPVISDLDWHGGITFYEKQRDGRGKVIGYRLGCDYMHGFDEGRDYDLPLVTLHAQNTINALWKLVPNLKLCCGWNGKYYNQDEIYYTDKGVCVALENKEKYEKPLFSPTS